MSKSPISGPEPLEDPPLTIFKLLPGEELPGVLRCSPRIVSTSQSRVRSLGADSLPYETAPCLLALPHYANVKSKDDTMEDFKEVIRQKIALTKLLLHFQRAYEEREMHLRRYISKGDIERLNSTQNPLKDTGSISAKYFQAIFDHNNPP